MAATTASSLLAAASASTSRAAISARRTRAAASVASSSRSSCPPLRASPARRLRSRVVASAAPAMQPPAVSRVSTVVDVDLGDRSYPIYIGPGLLDEPDLLQRHVIGKRVLVVTNTTVAPLYLEKVTWALTHNNPNVSVESVILPDGEKYKDMDTLMKVFDKAVESRLDRRCTFVALGGGVIGDMCGFAAAAFLRGVNFIQIPTTLMAQVDSSVGGKTGINHPLGKNLIGAFYQPQWGVLPGGGVGAGLGKTMAEETFLSISVREARAVTEGLRRRPRVQDPSLYLSVPLGEMPCYYDVDDILMEEEPISVVFQVTANGVGLLDPGAERNSVEKGAKVDLPFWLAHGMLSLEQAVSINVPPCFTQKTRKEIQADAACVDLRVRCPYFYELGCKIVPLVSDKSIGQFLHYAFTSRYKEILSKSHSSSTTTVPKFAPRLTKEEAQVFDSARESMTAFKKWRVGGARLQKASILGRKRKTKLPDGSSTP